jgi:hypothetical protein
LTVNASDLAETVPNDMSSTNTSSVNVSATCPVEQVISTGGGGGSRGTGSAIECKLSDWTCYAWGDCVNGVQRRTCTKIANCYDTGKNRPEMLRTCTMPQTGGEVQQPAELVVTQPEIPVEQIKPTAPTAKLTMWDQLKANMLFWLLLFVVLLALVYFVFMEKGSNIDKIIAKYKGKGHKKK